MVASDNVPSRDSSTCDDNPPPKTRLGRGKAWLNDENVGLMLAVCALPDAAIDGANMRSERYEFKVYCSKTTFRYYPLGRNRL
jgi:hypothetical protein